MGDIPESEIRALLKHIRTDIHKCKQTIWKVRNELNFTDAVEAERATEQRMRESIRKHIAQNEAARTSTLTVDEVADMEPEERQQWQKETTDALQRQPKMDMTFVRLQALPRRIHATGTGLTLAEMVRTEQERKKQLSRPQPKIDKQFQSVPAEQRERRGISPEEYHKLQSAGEQKTRKRKQVHKQKVADIKERVSCARQKKAALGAQGRKILRRKTNKAKTKLPVNAFKSLCSRADGGDGTKVLLLCEGLQLP